MHGPEALTERWRSRVPVPWARLGPAARIVARRRVEPPPVLVLSMPRSGSSWVGSTLGRAPDAAYLREPLTHEWARVRHQPAVFEVDPEAPRPRYRAAADLAFAGIPRFPSAVVRDSRQWRPHQTGRRIVVKEVNPLAARWLLRTYRPTLIYLLRHPAAVAESTFRQPWPAHGYDELFLSRHRTSELRSEEVGPDPWRRLGALQAHVAREISAVLDEAATLGIAARLQSYEQLCADPVGEFRGLFDFAGLRWDDDVAAAVRVRSTGGADDDAEHLVRDSRLLPDLWRTSLSAEQIAAVRDAYFLFDPPLYRADSW